MVKEMIILVFFIVIIFFFGFVHNLLRDLALNPWNKDWITMPKISVSLSFLSSACSQEIETAVARGINGGKE